MASKVKRDKKDKPRLLVHYEDVVVDKLKKHFKYDNVMEVPRLEKITLNIGCGAAAVADKQIVKNAMNDLMIISGRKPIQTTARKSIAAFKIREGWPLGCKVTLRKELMYEFMDKLISIAIPRIRDFRGFSARSFDGRGNYSFGIKEQIVFPEIDFDKVDKIRGLNVTITTSAKTNEECLQLMLALGFPLKVD